MDAYGVEAMRAAGMGFREVEREAEKIRRRRRGLPTSMAEILLRAAEGERVLAFRFGSYRQGTDDLNYQRVQGLLSRGLLEQDGEAEAGREGFLTITEEGRILATSLQNTPKTGVNSEESPPERQ